MDRTQHIDIPATADPNDSKGKECQGPDAGYGGMDPKHKAYRNSGSPEHRDE